MLKENWRTIARLERTGDFFIIIISFFLAYYSRASLIFWNEQYDLGVEFTGSRLAPIKDYFIVLVVALVGYSILLNMLRAYSSMRMRSSLELVKISLVSSIVVFGSLATIIFLLKLELSRSFLGLFCVLVTLFLAAERMIVLEFLRYWRKRGKNFRNVLIAGVGEQAIKLADEILTRPELGIRIRGFVDLSQETCDDSHDEFKSRLTRWCGRVIPRVSGLQKAVKDYAIDEVIFTDITSVMPEVERSLFVCAEQGVRTTVAANLFSIGMVRSQMSYFGSTPLIHFETPPGDRWELTLKRFLDVFISGGLLILLSPLLIVLALLIKITSRGPVFFVQRRVGQNGRLFDLYKFRSMVEDAELLLDGLKSKNEMQGPVFKIKKDPRVTSLGYILRKYSLDELPQLWNVFIGDMSLVGPRPPVPGEVSLYEPRERRRLSMRPGLTCTWQVSGRQQIHDFDSWVKMDLEYIDNWSLGGDLWLMIRTIPAVLSGSGA